MARLIESRKKEFDVKNVRKLMNYNGSEAISEDPVSFHLFELIEKNPEIKPIIENLIEKAERLGKTKVSVRPLEGLNANQKTAISLDALTELAYDRMTILKLYSRWRSDLIDSNVKTVNDILSIQLLLSRTGDDPIQLSFAQKARKGLKNSLLLLFPWHLKQTGIRLNAIQLRVYKRYGPKGLYRYLYHTHGSAIAIKYWIGHISMAKLAATVTVAALVSPTLYKSIKEWQESMYDGIDENEVDELKEIVTNYERSPNELLDYVKKSLSDSRESPRSRDSERLIKVIEELENEYSTD